MSIPKKIHYCWFGGNPLPESALKCIESWKKYCPDYEIIEWNESNFDVNQNNYVREAYESKKYAFVTDYVRLYVLNNYGGIYMDTDVEVLKSLDRFLNNKAFSGFETSCTIPTGIMGAEKESSWISYLLNYYDNSHFILEDGSMNFTTNVQTITNMTKEKYKVDLVGNLLDIKDVVAIYPKEYFCPKEYETGKIKITENTYTIHHFNASWHNDDEKMYRKELNRYTRILGKNIGGKFVSLKFNLKKNGLRNTIKKIIEYKR